MRSSILLRMEKREGPYFLCRLRTSRQVLGKHGRWTLRRSEGIYYAECGLPLRDVAGLNKLSSPASFKLIRSTDVSARPSDEEMLIGFLSFIIFHREILEIHDQEKHFVRQIDPHARPVRARYGARDLQVCCERYLIL